MIVPPPLFAAAVVSGTLLIGSVGDYEFTARWPNGETLHVCAKPPIVQGHVTLDPCADAMRGLWQPLDMPPIGEAELSCRAKADCFSAESLCIAQYNCGRE